MYIKEFTFKIINADLFLRKFSLVLKTKKRLMESLVYNENIDAKDLNERANMVKSCKEAVDVIKEYEDIIKTNKKNIIFFAYQQGKLFRKFKENKQFKSLIKQFKINKGTMIFKVNIVKLVDKFSKMITLSVTLSFLKSPNKDIKNIRKKNHEDFK